ncbi:hypothetical protein [Ascidiimonas sp. W6]|uniref:hypothetical protein n=1 Tax=Ascidiimonas meishanensis TaxID=3128903 RepID=UPI0030EC3B47
MKLNFLFSIVTLLIFSSCTVDDSQDIAQQEPTAILTLEMDSDYLQQGDTFYYLVQNIEDENITSGFGSLNNSQSITLESNNELDGLNVSLFTYRANQNRIEAKTYLNINPEQLITIRSRPSGTSTESVQVQLSNVPNRLDEFVFSANNRFTPGSLSIIPPNTETSFGIGNYANLQTTFTTIEDVSSSIPKYQVLTLTSDEVNQVDVAAGTEMENSHQITSSISDVQLRTKLVGYQNSDFENPDGNNLLYNTYSPVLSQNNFTVYSMNNFFSNYQLSIYAQNVNAAYLQVTNGTIPSEFTPIDPVLTIEQASFLNYQINTDNTFTTSKTFWTLKGENGISDALRWEVYANGNQSNFTSLSSIPANLPEDFDALKDLEELHLEYARAIEVPNTNYDELITIIFDGNDLSLLPIIYSKTIDTP